jgi:cytochrome c
MSQSKSNTMLQVLAALVVAATPTFVLAQPDDLVEQGHELYEARCEGCHSVREDRVGPRHRDLVGRPVAAIPNFAYSPALYQLGGIWTPERLDQWLQDPQAMAPGSDMRTRVEDADQRKAIIAYLASVSSLAH